MTQLRATSSRGLPCYYASAASSRRWALNIPVPGRSAPTACFVDASEDAVGAKVILVVEDQANHGLSVTNAAEHVYAAIAKHPGIVRTPGEVLRVWECYDPASGYDWQDAHVDEVFIRPGGAVVWAPIWHASPNRVVSPRDVPALVSFGFLPRNAGRDFHSHRN